MRNDMKKRTIQGHTVPFFRAICGAGGLSVRLSQIPDEGLVLQRGKAPLVFAVVEFFKPPPEVGVQLHLPPQLPDRTSRRTVREIPACQVCHINCIHTVSFFYMRKITPQQSSVCFGVKGDLLRSGRPPVIWKRQISGSSTSVPSFPAFFFFGTFLNFSVDTFSTCLMELPGRDWMCASLMNEGVNISSASAPELRSCT